MKKIWRAILAISIAITAFVGLSVEPEPADATVYWYLAPGQPFTINHEYCSATFYHANYGNVFFARMQVNNAGCSGQSRVMAKTWGDTSTPCSYLHDHSQYPDCSSSMTEGWVQAVAVGPGIASWWSICSNSCIEIWFTPIQ